MSHVPHELHEEFPEHAERIRALKGSNAHFAKLTDDYHELNRQIHRIEADVEPASDEYAEQLKRQRLALKDEIFSLLHG